MSVRASVIVTTYNAPDSLQVVLNALNDQTCQDFEIIIADDGSTEPTKTLVDRFRQHTPLTVKYVWQPDEGFQAGKIRNKAAAIAEAPYLIFIDGDSIPRITFVQRHLALARPGLLIPGSRILISQQLTQDILSQKVQIHGWSFKEFRCAYKEGKINRLHTVFNIPLGWIRYTQPKKWEGVKTCDLGLWKKDLIAVNGFDERFVGWGYEDSDLVLRMLRNGIFRKSAKFSAPVIHLFHAEHSKHSADANLAKLKETMYNKKTKASLGIDQYLPRPTSLHTLSVTIITLNEEKNIRHCLESVKWANEIIVIDSGSSDRTVDICREYTPHVYVKDWPGYGQQKNRALELATQEYVLSLDADEILSEALQQEIQTLLQQPTLEYTAYRCKRKSTFMNKVINHGEWNNDSVLRLFKRGSARFTTDPIHETLKVNGTIGLLKHIIIHHTVIHLENALKKMNQYSSLNAIKYNQKNKTSGLYRAWLGGTWAFWRSYLFKLGFLDGREGYLVALLTAQGSFYKYIKAYYFKRAERNQS